MSDNSIYLVDNFNMLDKHAGLAEPQPQPYNLEEDQSLVVEDKGFLDKETSPVKYDCIGYP